MKYIALLRAVNVGGHNKVPMAELRNALEAIGLQQVQTYIQSGNILFDADDPEDSVQQRVAHQIQDRFGFPVDVILRTGTDIDQVVAACPFLEQLETVTSSSAPMGLYLAFFNERPNPDAVAALARYADPQEQYELLGRDMYLLLRRGTPQSKLSPQVQKMGTPATLRNWKTVQKLHALAHPS